jgi:hypothetical protein
MRCELAFRHTQALTSRENIKLIKSLLFLFSTVIFLGFSFDTLAYPPQEKSHCDLNPANVLFDGEDYFFIDWQAASLQSFYFDLACCAGWFYFYNEDLCALILNSYFGREPTELEKAKYYLMRVFTNIYFGIGFISLPLKKNSDFPILNDADIEKLPAYLSFMQSLGSGQSDLSDPKTQHNFGLIFLKTSEKMMDDRYEQAYKLLMENKS